MVLSAPTIDRLLADTQEERRRKKEEEAAKGLRDLRGALDTQGVTLDQFLSQYYRRPPSTVDVRVSRLQPPVPPVVSPAAVRAPTPDITARHAVAPPSARPEAAEELGPTPPRPPTEAEWERRAGIVPYSERPPEERPAFRLPPEVPEQPEVTRLQAAARKMPVRPVGRGPEEALRETVEALPPGAPLQVLREHKAVTVTAPPERPEAVAAPPTAEEAKREAAQAGFEAAVERQIAPLAEEMGKGQRSIAEDILGREVTPIDLAFLALGPSWAGFYLGGEAIGRGVGGKVGGERGEEVGALLGGLGLGVGGPLALRRITAGLEQLAARRALGPYYEQSRTLQRLERAGLHPAVEVKPTGEIELVAAHTPPPPIEARAFGPAAAEAAIPRLTPRPAPLQDFIRSGFEETPTRRIVELVKDVPVIDQAITLVSPSALARRDPVAMAWIGFERLRDNINSALRVGLSAIAKSPFPKHLLDAEGNVMIVRGPTRGGRLGVFVTDVIERYGQYRGTRPELDRWIENSRRLIDEAWDYAGSVGLKRPAVGFGVGEAYFPRQAINKHGIDLLQRGGKPAGLGAKPYSFRTRFYEFAEEGTRNGIDYAKNPDALLETYLRAIYQYSAETEFINLVSKKGMLASAAVSARFEAQVATAENRLKNATTAYNFARQSVRGTPPRPTLAGKGISPRVAEAVGEINRLIHSMPPSSLRASQIRPWRELLKDIVKQERQAFKEARTARSTEVRRLQQTGVWRGEEVLRAGVQVRRPEEWEGVAVAGVRGAPGLSGQLFKKEVSDYLVKQLEAQQVGTILRQLERASAAARIGMTGFDTGFWFLQGLGLLADDAANWSRGQASFKWGRAFTGSLRALKDPQSQFAYMHRQAELYPDQMRRFVQYYRALSTAELSEAARPGGLIARVPGAKRLMGAFDAFLDIGAFEMWKGTEHLARGDAYKLEQLGAWLRNTLGVLSTRSLGVGANQRAVEAAVIRFAPRYTRGAVAWVWDAMTAGGLRGDQSRRSLAALLSGIAITHAAISELLGQEPEFRPWAGGRFVSNKIGNNYYGPSGPVRSLIAMMGGLIYRSIEDPSALAEWRGPGLQDNPIARYLVRAGAAPLTGTVIDLILGETYIGEPMSLDPFHHPEEFLRVPERLLPFGVKAFLEAHGNLVEKTSAGLMEFLGGRSFPVPPWELKGDIAEDLAAKAPEGSELARMRGRDLENWSGAALTELERLPEVQKLTKEMAETDPGRYRLYVIRNGLNSAIKLAGLNLEKVKNPRDYWDAVANAEQNARIGEEEARQNFDIERKEPGPEAPERQLMQQRFKFVVEPSIDPWGRLVGEKFGERDKKLRQIIGPEREALLDRELVADADPVHTQMETWRQELSHSPYYDAEAGSARTEMRKADPHLDALVFLGGSAPTTEKPKVRTPLAQQEVIRLVRERFGWEWTEADVPIAER